MFEMYCSIQIHVCSVLMSLIDTMIVTIYTLETETGKVIYYENIVLGKNEYTKIQI